MRFRLRCHDAHDRILEYESDNGRFREKSRSEFPAGRPLARGFYGVFAGTFAGVYASREGPVFFRDAERHLLSNGAWSAEIVPGVNDNLFVLKRDGCERVSMRYPRPRHGNIDVWSDEEMNDFFLWFSRNLTQQRFSRHYTIMPPAPEEIS